MDSWNFHGYIALPLETYLKRCGEGFCKSADEIEAGAFVEAMFSLLSIKNGDLSDFTDFIELCKPYEDIPVSKIPKEKAIEMYKKFNGLIEREVKK